VTRTRAIRHTAIRCTTVSSILPLICAISLGCHSFVKRPQPIRVLLIGDSITRGKMEGPEGPNFAEQLSQRLGAKYQVEKYACSGTTSTNWIPGPGNERAWCGENLPWMMRDLYKDYVARNLPADIVVLLLGTNDAQKAPKNRDHRRLAAKYRRRMERIVDHMLEDGTGHIFLMPPPKLSASFGRRAGLIELFRDQLNQIAGSRDRITFGPDLYELLNRRDHFTKGPHPTLVGHTLIAEALHDAIASHYGE
jgi:lysophospholipase L1-like esterase